MLPTNTKSLIPYNGHFYKEVSEFIGGEGYLEYKFTKGTVQEVDWLIKYLNLPEGSRILDIGCGPGRHSLELARRIYQSVGVDLSKRFVDFANKQERLEDLSAEFIVADARHLKLPKIFDAAISLCEGAFGLAGSDEDHLSLLKGIYNSLKPNGIFVLTVKNALNCVQQIENPKLFDAYTNTTVQQTKLTNLDGNSKEVELFRTAFTYREVKLLLEAAGFELIDAFGCTSGKFSEKPLDIHDNEIMAVAKKV